MSADVTLSTLGQLYFLASTNSLVLQLIAIWHQLNLVRCSHFNKSSDGQQCPRMTVRSYGNALDEPMRAKINGSRVGVCLATTIREFVFINMASSRRAAASLPRR